MGTCQTCGNFVGTTGTCFVCAFNQQQKQKQQIPPNAWSGVFDYSIPQPFRLSDEDVDRIAQSVLDKLVRGLKL